MKKRIITYIFLLFSSVYCFGQNQTDEQKILEFKKDFLDSDDIFKPDTLRLNNKILIRERFPNVRLIKTFEDNIDLVYYEYFYNDTNILDNTIFYNSKEKPVGISKQYYEDGSLDYIEDFDRGEWIVSNKNDYPFYSTLDLMKKKADSLIIKVYGADFLKNHCTWSVSGSYVYSDNESADWKEKFNFSPTKFLFRYDVKLDSKHNYDDLIEFEIDDKGNFIPNQYEQIFGFEKVPENLKGKFKLNYTKALEIAKENGLKENNSTEIFSALKWECFKKPEFFNGVFRFYLSVKVETIENLIPDGRSSRISKFEVYSFNPWNGEFIEKKKMKSIYSWEKNSGNQTGLIPDEE